MTLPRRLFLCLLLAGLAGGCASLHDLGNATTHFFEPLPPRGTPLAAPQEQLPKLEARIRALIDAERTKADPTLPTLNEDADLTAVARMRSDKMAKDNSFADTGGDPHISASLLMARDPKFQGLVGENVAAQHYNAGENFDADVFAQRFAESWVASEAHRQNLLMPDYRRTGVGAALNGDTIYVTQLFAAELKVPPPAAEPAPPAAAAETGAVPQPRPAEALPAAHGQTAGNYCRRVGNSRVCDAKTLVCGFEDGKQHCRQEAKKPTAHPRKNRKHGSHKKKKHH
jgi:uncharacterized protein YkwD